MWLILDAVKNRVGRAAKLGGTINWEKPSAGRRDWVAALGQDASQIKEVTVIQGDAGFSDTRAVVLVANILAWLKPKVSIFDCRVVSADSVPEDGAAVMALSKPVEIAKPVYRAEPNITKPKN